MSPQLKARIEKIVRASEPSQVHERELHRNARVFGKLNMAKGFDPIPWINQNVERGDIRLYFARRFNAMQGA